ncbi:MAG TPA: tRNA uridine-5-carboxymethylaminomethyl(34) synthesis GTPase MnmE [Rikenellaceae bacterium]|nr:tRNA uridine-5-carboxymethylaminomethyl(34) synthesis GTPase MnmE [Rikenellaceae bacterium]
MFDRNDTICAPASGNGGAVSIIRVSGIDSLAVIDSLVSFVKGDATSSAGYRLKRGVFTDLDDVLVAIFRAPHSYTGEDSVEIYCHASPFIIRNILDQLCSHGCRMAEPGEFTRRAFLNGKMDLAQAEAVSDVITSCSEVQHRVAMSQLRGGYSNELRAIRGQLVELSALLELELDFAEEDVEFADRSKLRGILNSTRRRCRELANSFKMGNAIKNGVPVAIVGAPNSGKSTLLNALLKEDRAIISDIPGTTRDTVEETCVIGGILFRFIDTAGIRESDDVIEKMGIQRSFAKLREASIVLALVDGTLSGDEILSQAEDITKRIDFDKQRLILVLNKCDKVADSNGDNIISDRNIAFNKNVSVLNNYVLSIKDKTNTISITSISAKYSEGLQKIEELLVKACNIEDSDSILVTSARHARALENSAIALGKVSEGLDAGIPTDLLAEDLREALAHLGSITGEITNDEVLGEIFSKFCIGK